MGRGAVGERVQQEAELLPGFLIAEADDLENLLLNCLKHGRKKLKQINLMITELNILSSGQITKQG